MERLTICPDTVYKNRWLGWGAFLGTGKPRRPFVVRRTVAQWVIVAEKMASENGGRLRSQGWLQNNKLAGLSQVIRKHQEAFCHIEQEKPSADNKSSEDWVAVAENLSKKNRGELPWVSWLNKNGYKGMTHAMRKRPELFAHIKRQKHGKSLNQWISVAEKLSHENGGMLQSVAWLVENKYFGLLNSITNHPGEYAHLKQERRTKTVVEWVEIADSLAGSNNGFMPSKSWLCKNHLQGLVTVMRKHPESFSHLRQEVRDTKGRVVAYRGAAV